MEEVLQEGRFCTECEWFETDERDQERPDCPSCGCPNEAHRAAKVVAA